MRVVSFSMGIALLSLPLHVFGHDDGLADTKSPSAAFDLIPTLLSIGLNGSSTVVSTFYKTVYKSVSTAASPSIVSATHNGTKSSSTVLLSFHSTAASTQASYPAITNLESFLTIGPGPTTSHGYAPLPSFTHGSYTPTPTPWARLKADYNKWTDFFLDQEPSECSRKNVTVRHSWHSMTDGDRKAYTAAAQCLHIHLPNKAHTAAGSRFRADDFTAAHIIEGYKVEFTGLFFHWHRWFLSLYEKALQTECNYTGTLPYWDFSMYASNMSLDPIFDARDNSFGDRGAPYPDPHNAITVPEFGHDITVQPGTGGSCQYDGPWRQLKVRLGKSPTYRFEAPNTTVAYPVPTYDDHTMPDPSFLAFNDRCMSRDLNPVAGLSLNISHVEYALWAGTVDDLLARVNGLDVPQPFNYSIINGFRAAIGGQSLDWAAGAGDPIFYLAVANVDRLFSIWQYQNTYARLNATGGTLTPFNSPPSFRVDGSTPLEFPGLAGLVTVMDAFSPLKGGFCYRYGNE